MSQAGHSHGPVRGAALVGRMELVFAEVEERGVQSAEKTVIQAVHKELFIDGKWRASSTGRSLPVEDPSTGEVLCEVADAGVEDGLAALDAAVAAQKDWAAYAPHASAARSCVGRTSCFSTALTIWHC